MIVERTFPFDHQLSCTVIGYHPRPSNSFIFNLFQFLMIVDDSFSRLTTRMIADESSGRLNYHWLRCAVWPGPMWHISPGQTGQTGLHKAAFSRRSSATKRWYTSQPVTCTWKRNPLDLIKLCLTLSLPVMEVIKLFIFISFWKSQWTNQCFHELKTVVEFWLCPVVDVAMAPFISDFSAYVLGIGLNMSGKNRRICQYP